jgi:flagellar protein FliL
MSATPASTADAAAATPAKAGKRKIIVLALALLAVLAAGGGAYFMMKKRAAAQQAEQGEQGEQVEDVAEAAKAARADVKKAPTFVPLDPFTVNLADRDAERYAQVGMTLELSNAKAADLLKAYMPAIRNNILLALASKTAGQLMEHEGKLQLAAELRVAALKPLGYAVKPGTVLPPPGDGHDDDDDEDTPPIRAVHFSNFIIQ